jgi:hypothetical protein
MTHESNEHLKALEKVKSPRRSNRRSIATAAVLIAGLLCISTFLADPRDTDPRLPDPELVEVAQLRVDDGTTLHVFPPGERFDVQVSVTGITSDVFLQWHDPRSGPLSEAVVIKPPVNVTLQSPSTQIGHYELKIWSPDPLVQFPPQNPGFHRWYGFSILPTQTVSDRPYEPESFFGIIHHEDDDPYLRGGTKSVWTKQSPHKVMSQLQEQRSKGLEELPAIASDQLSWDHTTPVTQTRLEEFRGLIRPFMKEIVDRRMRSPNWQLGVEIDNRLDDGPYGIPNYCKFAQILRDEMDAIGAHEAKIVSSFDGFDYDNAFGPLIAHPECTVLDAIGTDPYIWWAPDRDFTMPEDRSRFIDAPWLENHIRTLRRYMDANPDGPQEIWFTEMGIPHGGNYNPDTFFGYPGSGVSTAKRDRLYTANYLLRSHVIALGTGDVSRIYWYNYRDRGGDLDYAEHHFGLRAYREESGDEGFPKPAYTAYAVMVDILSGAEHVEHRSTGSSISAHRFTMSDGTPVWVLWRRVEGTESVDVDDLFEPGHSAYAHDLFGKPVELSGRTIEVDQSAIYLYSGEPGQSP